MKILALTILIFFMAQVVKADFGVLLISSGTVVAKEVYQGNATTLPSLATPSVFKDNSFSFQIFDLSVSSNSFNASNVPLVLTRRALKAQSLFTLKNQALPILQRIQALLIIQDLDQ